jgi:hypothetical protein
LLTEPLFSCNILFGKWVYKLKLSLDSEVLKYKACWVVQGFEQLAGLDYSETFASIVKLISYKLLFALAAAYNLKLEQINVKTAFFYSNINKEIYVEQLPGFIN